MSSNCDCPKKMLICCCADYRLVREDSIRGLHAAALKAGIEVELCADLCLESIKNPERLKSISRSGTVVAACRGRAVKSLFACAGVDAPGVCADLRHEPLADILDSLGLDEACVAEEMSLPCYQSGWKAWFPVIDSERCVDCGKCVDFCFFGVYRRNDASRVEVAFPEQCKTDCPACARMCPHQAIVFPKHMDSPINGGMNFDAVAASDENDKRFDENLYQRLAARRRSGRNRKLLKD